MNNKFKKTLEAEVGRQDERKETLDRLFIRAIKLLRKEENFGDYTKPPIPEGYSHVEGKWDTGFVIQDELGNQYVWIPVGVLPSNGTLDGKHFTEKFGRRNYRNDEFSQREFHEDIEKKQLKSVQKYGGFYISRYTISKSANGNPASVKDAMPWTRINFYDAVKESKKFGQGIVQSHLWYGAECDSVLEWLKKTGKHYKDIVEDSTSWGNYCNCENSHWEVVETGSCKKWYANNIADLAGNVWEWTQEVNNSLNRVLRCGSCITYGDDSPVAYRDFGDAYNNYSEVGFRVALYIEQY